MQKTEVRRQSFALTDEQLLVQSSFADFFGRSATSVVVRAAQPLGHDASLWARLTALGVPALAVPASAGGDGATMIDLVLLAEEFGRTVAPLPLLSQLAVTRLLARIGVEAGLTGAVAAGQRLVALAPSPLVDGRRQLVPDAAITADVLAVDGEGIALFSTPAPPGHVPNQGSTPLAWFDPAGATRRGLLDGPAAHTQFDRAVAEWKLLLAAALVGLTDSALRLAVEFVKTRRTLGVSIATLQGVSHPLADVAMGLHGARNLVRKAAWYAEFEPEQRPDLPLAALDYAARTAGNAGWVCAHLQGGLGFTVEADISLFFLRAKGWSALAGDRSVDRRRISTLRIDNV